MYSEKINHDETVTLLVEHSVVHMTCNRDITEYNAKKKWIERERNVTVINSTFEFGYVSNEIKLTSLSQYDI